MNSVCTPYLLYVLGRGSDSTPFPIRYANWIVMTNRGSRFHPTLRKKDHQRHFIFGVIRRYSVSSTLTSIPHTSLAFELFLDKGAIKLSYLRSKSSK